MVLFFLKRVTASHPGRDFMGQGAPPISQQLKQLVDVEAWQLGDFRNPYAQFWMKHVWQVIELLLLKAVLLKYDTYIHIYIYNVYTVLQNNVCLPWCFGLPFPLLNRSYQKILFAPASMDFRSMATIRMVGLKTMMYQTMPCSFWYTFTKNDGKSPCFMGNVTINHNFQ